MLRAPRVAVVGAGIGGLAAAFRLRQAGCEPVVFERSGNVGGRMATVVKDGYVFDVGAGLLPSSYARALALTHDAGLDHLLERVTGLVAVPRGPRTHHLSLNSLALSLATTSLISLGSKLSMLRLIGRGVRLSGLVKGETLAALAGHDEDLLSDYANGRISTEAFDYIVEPTMRALYLQNGDQAVAAHFFWCVANLVASGTYSLRGGMDALARALAARLEVRYATEVTAVSRSPQGCCIESVTADGSRQAHPFDGCIIALDASGLRALYPGGLTQAQQAYLANLRYSTSVNVHLGLNPAPAARAVLFQIARPEDPHLAAIVLDHLKGSDRAPPGKGVLSAFFTSEWSASMFDRSDADVLSEARRRIARFIPEAENDVEVAHVHRWRSAATMSAPGVFSLLAGFVADMDAGSPVQFCGDFFSESSVNECVKQGELAASRLAVALTAEH